MFLLIPIGDDRLSEDRPIVTYSLVAINVLIYAAVTLPRSIMEYMPIIHKVGFIPAEFNVITLFTSQFFHADFWHVLGNMLFLFIFGANVETLMRPWRYAIFYLACGVAACLVFNAIHIAAQVGPLRVDYSSEHHVVCLALEHVAESAYADNPGLTQHTLILYLRKNTDSLYGNEAAIRGWQRAEPGTVFFWDSKYCHKPHKAASTRRLREELRRLGELVFQATDRGKSVEVFVRRPNPKGPQP